jgi:ribosomal-protein-alanine N-acetyltransferase
MLSMFDNDGKLVGTTGYPRIAVHNNSAEYGIIIHHPYWGNGYSTEAHLMGLELGFETLKFHRVEFVTQTENKPMRSFFEKFGIHCEGVRREANLQNGVYKDDCTYSILIHEWPLVKEKMIASIKINSSYLRIVFSAVIF